MIEALRGVGPALVTPFNEDHTIDYAGLEKLLIHTAKGVDYWVVQGTTGESATTTFEEKQAILQFVKAHNPKNLPIVFGAGGNNTLAVKEFIEKSDLSGVEAILSASPSYNKPSQQGIYQHFVQIADVSPVPVILYNVPGRTASNMTASTTLRLAEHPNIVGIKEASGNLEQCMQIAANKPEDFMLISGDDLLSTIMISFGAVGVISVLANGFPTSFSKAVHLALENNFAEASKELAQFLPINPLMYEESNPVGLKEVLKKKEICENYVRMPLLPASDSLKTKIASLL